MCAQACRDDHSGTRRYRCIVVLLAGRGDGDEDGDLAVMDPLLLTLYLFFFLAFTVG